jgi:hypothetical protein
MRAVGASNGAYLKSARVFTHCAIKLALKMGGEWSLGVHHNFGSSQLGTEKETDLKGILSASIQVACWFRRHISVANNSCEPLKTDHKHKDTWALAAQSITHTREKKEQTPLPRKQVLRSDNCRRRSLGSTGLCTDSCTPLRQARQRYGSIVIKQHEILVRTFKQVMASSPRLPF